MYICCHRAGKAKDLYSRSFLLDEKTPRRDGRVARERQDEEREREKERERQRGVVSGRAPRGLSREWQKERKDDGEDERRKGRKEENAVEDGRRGGGEGRSAALGERAG